MFLFLFTLLKKTNVCIAQNSSQSAHTITAMAKERIDYDIAKIVKYFLMTKNISVFVTFLSKEHTIFIRMLASIVTLNRQPGPII